MLNADRVIQPVRPDYDAISAEARKLVDISIARAEEVFFLERHGYSNMYFQGGQRWIFYREKLKEIDGVLVAGEPLTTLWDDLLSNNLHNEGGVEFPKGKKPEALIKRCVELSTEPGDLVLDLFAGSGTTGAVAHKMGRRWIMVELGEHAITHCVPRLKKVIDGADPGGITEAMKWKGGGGFRFYRIAPSLLTKDRFGNWVIAQPATTPPCWPRPFANSWASPMRRARSRKIIGGTAIQPRRDFIYVTTQSLTHDALKKLSEEVGPERTLLVCCKALNGSEAAIPNLTVKKIPQAVLRKCEWGRDDYSLTVANLPVAVEQMRSNRSPTRRDAETVPAKWPGRPRKVTTGGLPSLTPA